MGQRGQGMGGQRLWWRCGSEMPRKGTAGEGAEISRGAEGGRESVGPRDAQEVL